MAQIERQTGQGTTDDLDRIGEGLANVFRAGHSGRFHARLARTAGVDLDRTGFVMLGKVAHAGSIRVSDLAEQMGLDISTVSRKAQQLEAAELVERTGDPGDRRAAMISIAVAGKRTLGLLRRERSRAIGELTADWTAEERSRFADLLERFSQGMLRGPGGAS
jgi:DNA-binding MarR family transcriptional regulator